MKNYFLTFLLILSGALAAQTLKSDPPHTQLSFTVTHLTISHITGNFGDFSVELDYTKEDFTDAKFTLSADVASINTGVKMRDDHLRSTDFFDVENFPKMNFTTTSIDKVFANKYKLHGNLTMHGVTRPITLDLTYNGHIEDSNTGAKTFGFTVKGNLKRTDYGVGVGFPGAVISDEVKLVAFMEFKESK